VEIAPVGGCIPFVVADDDDDEDDDEEDDDASIASKRYPTPRLILLTASAFFSLMSARCRCGVSRI
jgi:hypothetical protein